MARYENDQTKLLIPLSRDGLINQPTTSLQHRSKNLEENDWLTTIGQSTYELHDFSSLERLASAQLNCGSSKSGYAQMLPSNECPNDTDLHQCPEHTPGRIEKQKRTWMFSGWRVGVISNACVATTVLILNLVLTVWASLSFPMNSGLGTLIQGDCDKVKSWALWLHLAINALSTLLLGASNYTMQCLLAPTRREVDKAHKEGKMVSIGIGGVKNLKHVGLARAIIYIMLVFSSVPLHLLYNSAIYKTLTARQYSVYVVNEAFIRGAGYNESLYNYYCCDSGCIRYNECLHNDGLCTSGWYPFGCYMGLNTQWNGLTVRQSPLKELQQNISALQKLTPSECIAAYATDFLTNHGSLIAVTNSTFFDGALAAAAGATSESSLYGWTQSNVSISTTGGGLGGFTEDPLAWMCADIAAYHNATSPCSLSMVQTAVSNWTIFNYSIDYCLSQQKAGLCTLEFSLVIMMVVIISNAVKAICMAFTVMSFGGESPLVTIGDAAASYLDHPDSTTEGLCLCDPKLIWLTGPLTPGFYTFDRFPKPFAKPKSFWLDATSPWGQFRWAVTNLLGISTLAVCGYLLHIGTDGLRLSGGTSITDLWNLGFGTVSARSLMQLSSGLDEPILSVIIIANTPQVILSALYFLYNSLYTSMFAEDEWQRYSYQRRPLRVSAPRGQQRSTYFLSLPYRYALSLMAIFGLLHWLVSQSIFLALVSIVDENDVPVSGQQITTCGWSNIAMIFVIIFGALIILGGLAMGFRRFNGYMPLARGSSISISAACHPHKLDKKGSVLPVQWGATDEEQPGHCTLTSRFVYAPVTGRLYA